LVSHGWQRPAQALLFHEIAIPHELAYRSLQATFEGQSEHSKWLRGCIRVLNYWIFAGGKHHAASWESRLPTTLKACPQLYELRLGVNALTKLQDKTITALNEMSPPIRALQIAMRTDDSNKTSTLSQVPLQLITSVTSWKLEFLVMRGEPYSIGSYSSYPEVSHQLTEFRWTIAGGHQGPEFKQFITWVTNNSLKTLEILNLPADHDIIGQIGPALRSLRVPDAKTLPKNLKGLKELILTTSIAAIPTEVSYYGSLPPNIVHLGLTTNALVSEATIGASLSHKLPQKLRTLSLYGQSVTRLGFNPYGTITSSGCYVAIPGEDVLIRIFNGFEACQVAMRSDLVRSKDYPRDVTIENMRYMSRVVSDNEDTTELRPLRRGLVSLIPKFG
jgi:hypothetical protein